MNAFIEPLGELLEFITLKEAVKNGITPVLATGAQDSQKAHLCYALCEELNKTALIVAATDLDAKGLYEDLRTFYNEGVYLFPSKGVVFYSSDAHSGDVVARRLVTINALLSGEAKAVILSADALTDRLCDRAAYESSVKELNTGDEIDQDRFIRALISVGYTRLTEITSPGAFAVRGGIIDIALPGGYAFRIELWGDTIDSIRRLDLETGRSFERVDKAVIYPAQDLFDNETSADLLDYIPRDTIIFFNEPNRVSEHISAALEEYAQLIEIENKNIKTQTPLVYSDILRRAANFPIILLTLAANTAADFKLKTGVSFSVKTQDITRGGIDALCDNIQALLKSKHRVLFLCGTGSRCRRMAAELTRLCVTASFIPDLSDYHVPKGCVVISKGALRQGFTYSDINFTIISDEAILARDRKKSAFKPKKTSKLDIFLDLKAGDYAVHSTHGVGVYNGIEKITDNGISKDYMKLAYKDGGVLYVPVNNMDSVSRYVGGVPKLSKLGGAEWGKTKSRAKGAIEILAKDLAALYAKRQSTPGFAFSEDSVWQAEFEEGFPYDETDDQLRSIAEVKADMEDVKVMDRLLCGDVGYGKTEVALRAAFKCVQDNKQVAYLVPTTILAQQHYNTFTRRMKDFPIMVELLSRFRTKKEQDESIKRLSKGLSDIVIGTHRILSTDISFKDLGLVIIDEEQRFGVSHKEKLKRLRENVDVLTLTATPIPRTLHMSLSGVRDLSSLTEPPLSRHPVQTYVLEYSPEFVISAIHRELARGGQVFYLFNRVRSIGEEAARLRRMVPQARIGVAHGQMPERELENIMQDFIERDIDVLVCTTIIETGLDISNVNTIIVNNADYMGLAQLYQLRGRVGRSDRIAYAYLTYRKDKILDEAAEKRLAAIREFTEFGSGFKIAMRDLELRGAGNLLGAEQHGHMDGVGYELYCHMLEDAVTEITGGAPAGKTYTLIDIKTNAYIPDYYIENEEIKLEIYKKIAAIENKTDRDDMADELKDRFGKVPKCVNELLDVAELKAAASVMGVNQISQKANNVIITFDISANPEVPGLMTAINKYKGKLFFTAGESPYITYKANENEIITPAALLRILADLGQGD